MKFFDDLYGIEEKSNKAALIFGMVMGILSLFCISAIVSIDVDTVTNIIRWYFSAFFASVSLFSFSSYFFSKMKGKNKYKKVKYIAFIISLVLLALVFLPVTILSFLTEIIKFNYFFRYSTIYIISIFIPMLIALIIWGVIYAVLFGISWMNVSAIAALVSFLAWRFGSWFALNLYHKVGKNKLNDKVFMSIKKDLYVFVFVMITLFTVVVNCINFPELYSSMLKGVTGAFAIYIAFDRLLGKWQIRIWKQRTSFKVRRLMK